MVNFKNIKEDKFAISFNTQEELEKLVDYLKLYGYQYGEGMQCSYFGRMDTIKLIGIECFADEKYVTLDKSRSLNICTLSKKENAPVYEFSSIEWGLLIKEKQASDDVWNVMLTGPNGEKSENTPAASGKYLCTCVQYYDGKETNRYLKMMEYNKDRNYWHDSGHPGAISHYVLAWTNKIIPCQFNDYNYEIGGRFVLRNEEEQSVSIEENTYEDLE